MTAIRDAILNHIEATTFESLPTSVVHATNMVIADTFACGLAGSAEAKAKTFRDVQLDHFGYGGAPVWGTDQIVDSIGAGMVNGYQVHCMEHASFHEAATVASMSVIFPTVMAYADRYGQVSGKRLITAVNIGNDVAVLLGLSAKQDARFYRPAVCGAMGAAAAIAKLADFDRPHTAEFFGLVYSQLCGTMQAHTEASPALGYQIAFNVRNVMTAHDMARVYLTGPVDVFDGPYGFFELFEVDGGPSPHLADLGKVWRMAEMSFKPFPDGSALEDSVSVVLGHPENPMTADQHRAKFMDSAAAAARPLNTEMAGRLYTRLQALQDEEDVSVLSNLAAGFDLEEEFI